MQRQHFLLLLTMPLLFLSVSFIGNPIQSAGSHSDLVYSQPSPNQAQQAIEAAQTAINSAYFNLIFADAAGSEITDLISTLNRAILELNQARQAYNQTDYSTAITLADGAATTAQTVSTEAQLRGLTTTAQTQSLIIVVVAVVLFSLPTSYFVVSRWTQYRKEKRRKFLRMEIRLPDDEKEEETS
ncbi:MAG: hypothetical protein ACFFCH_07200 [Promethearchaeota archaeon]